MFRTELKFARTAMLTLAVLAVAVQQGWGEGDVPKAPKPTRIPEVLGHLVLVTLLVSAMFTMT